MPNTLTALLKHPFPASLLCQARPQSSLFSAFLAAAATTHGLNEPLQGRHSLLRPRRSATAGAATARSPPLPTGPDVTPLPVGLGRESHLNATVPGSSEFVPQAEHSRETKAAGEKGRKGRQRLPAFFEVPAFTHFSLGLFPFSSGESRI